MMQPAPNRRPEEHVERVGMDTFRTWETVADQPLVSQTAAVAYINKLTEIVIENLGANAPAERLDVVVAVRPGKRANVWLISSLEPPPSRETLIKSLKSVEPFEVKKRPYAFAIYMRVGGAKRAEGFSGSPVPVEWSDAAKRKGGSVLIPDDIIEEIWDTPAPE